MPGTAQFTILFRCEFYALLLSEVFFVQWIMTTHWNRHKTLIVRRRERISGGLKSKYKRMEKLNPWVCLGKAVTFLPCMQERILSLFLLLVELNLEQVLHKLSWVFCLCKIFLSKIVSTGQHIFLFIYHFPFSFDQIVLFLVMYYFQITGEKREIMKWFIHFIICLLTS